MNVLAYIRVSTDEQADSGLGLEAQRAAIGRYVVHRGWTLGTVYEDAGWSGRNLQRPQLTEALGSVRKGEGLVVAKLDRLARSIHDFSGLVGRAQREGWTIACLDPEIDLTTCNGRLIANILASVAEWEREIIGDRIRAALRAKEARGEWLTRIPLDVAARVLMMREDHTLREIAERLNLEGVPTPRGGLEWRPSSIQRLIARQASLP